MGPALLLGSVIVPPDVASASPADGHWVTVDRRP